MFVEHKEALEAPQIPLKVKKLSDAIREGSKLCPKVKGKPFGQGY